MEQPATSELARPTVFSINVTFNIKVFLLKRDKCNGEADISVIHDQTEGMDCMTEENEIVLIVTSTQEP